MLYVIQEWDGTLALVDVVFKVLYNHGPETIVVMRYEDGNTHTVSQSYLYEVLRARPANRRQSINSVVNPAIERRANG